MPHIIFAVTDEDHSVITEIALRAVRDLGRDLIDTEMDITATHANGCPLLLEDLLEADDSNFAHDVLGIARHLDRQSGQLENHFLPRFHGKVALLTAH